MAYLIKSATEMAQEIRAELKKQGITSRQVSVKSGICGYSDYLHITIKTAEIDINKVFEIAKPYQYVDRDEVTGEILQGGNTYLRVKYSDNAFDGVADAYLPRAEQLIQEVTKGDYIAVQINDDAHLSHSCNGWIKLYDDNSLDRTIVHGAHDLAEYLYKLDKFGHI